ncbi:MAG TPA: thiamine phosphate synthase [Alphaproteobacteria bacterium]|nr:thiamine phosphate synthase [Alphaproteobacteria bacterium]
MNPLPDPAILAITDRRQCGEPLEARAAALFSAGCRFLSLREKDLAVRDRFALLGRLSALGRDYGATVCVHDDLPAAFACGTALHLPADGDVTKARDLLGPAALIGQSCHSRDEIIAAAAAGVDYVTLSPVFPSVSKPGYPTLAAIDIAGLGIPVLALGGIAFNTIARLPAGFAGVATMGQAMVATDPAAWFRAIRTAWTASRRA